MIVFFDITKDQLEKRLSHIKTKLKDVAIENHPEVKITMSFGGAYGTDLVKNMVETADKALYESKEVRDTYTVLSV